MLSGIWGLLSALPDLIKLVNGLVAWINHISGNDPQGYIKKVAEAMSTLNSAKTEEDRVNAAKAISKAISNLP